MLERQEVIIALARFIAYHALEVCNLLTVVECCLKEVRRRKVLDTEDTETVRMMEEMTAMLVLEQFEE